MRVSKHAAAENRRRILDAAVELFRGHGIDGAGVDAITEAASLLETVAMSLKNGSEG